MSKRARLTNWTSDGGFRIENKVSANTFTRLFLNETFADIHFVFKEEGVRIPAHKAILAAASDVFSAMLNGAWQEDNEVEIVDASADAFRQFLQFLYLPNVNISTGNFWELFYLADKYNIRECMELCEPDIAQRTTLKTVFKFLDLALQFDLKRLKDHCLDQICNGKTAELFVTEGFLRCSKDSLKNLLQVDAIGCEEIDLFDACINWAKRACEKKCKCPSDSANIRTELGDCLYSIRFGSMKPEQISKCISQHADLFTSSELQDIRLSISSDKSAVEIFKDIAPRDDLRPWDDRRSFHCILGTDCTHREMARTESTIFRVSKTLLFGAITVNKLTHRDDVSSDPDGIGISRCEARLFVFELVSAYSTTSDQKTLILQHKIHFDVRRTSHISEEILKFASIRLQANRFYEVRIERDYLKSLNAIYYNGTSIGTRRQTEFGDGVTIDTEASCSNFIRSFHFN